MKVEVNGRQIEMEPNSKPYLLKRVIADGFDTVLIFALFMLFVALVMKSSLAATYHSHDERTKAILEETVRTYDNDAKAVTEALNRNNEYQNERFAAALHGYLLKAAACLLAELLILLVIPLLNHFRATPGKLMTGIIPFNERRQSRAVWYQIVFRFLLIYLFDSLGLYLFTGILTFILVPVLRLMEMLLIRKNRTICDLMTGITIIEKLSYSGIN